MLHILYRPRLSNNKEAPLSWFIKFYRWNMICWPLEDKVPHWIYLLDRLLWILGFICFLIHTDGNIRYLYFSSDELDAMLTVVPTLLASIEIHLRAFSLGWRKNDFKHLLKKFYADIYIEKSTNVKTFKQIERQMWPVLIFSFLYLCTLSTYILKGLHILATNKRELLFKMIPLFDYKSNAYVYFFLLMFNFWVGWIVATTTFGEGNILAQLVFHLNGRYLMMRQTFNDKVDKLLKGDSNCHIVKDYERVLMETVKENLRLNRFAQEIQNEFTFRMFVMFAISAMSLCAVCFKAYTAPANSISYIFWAIAKIQDLLAIGQIGSTITATTDQLSSMYYESNWENIIVRCSNAQDNVKLMKFVNLSIVTNRKAFDLTGLNFFNVSLKFVLTVLKCAGSYLTFLISLR